MGWTRRLLPLQLRQSVGTGDRPLLVELPCPAPEGVSGADLVTKDPPMA
jgi:hypothetical protein